MVQEAATNVEGGGSTFAAPLMDYLSTNYEVPECARDHHHDSPSAK
jgi:hypothetical protein